MKFLLMCCYGVEQRQEKICLQHGPLPTPTLYAVSPHDLTKPSFSGNKQKRLLTGMSKPLRGLLIHTALQGGRRDVPAHITVFYSNSAALDLLYLTILSI